jgi:acyl-CoA synthetase (AMP-forming)/AMP-acid ligase II
MMVTATPCNTNGAESDEATKETRAKATSLMSRRSDEKQHIHFLDLVRATVSKNKSKTYASWYDINGNCDPASGTRTFGEIWETAGTIAYHLRYNWNVKKGQRVVLCYDFGLHFFEVFFGCLRAGVVAVLGKFGC